MHELRSFFRVQRRFLLLASLCALFSVAAGTYFVRYLLKPSTGLVVDHPAVVVDSGRVIFAPRARFSPAIEAGLLPGKDRILAINGVPVGSSRDVFLADSRVRGFDPVAVAVQRESGEIQTLRILPAFALTRLDSLFVLVFCASLLTVACVLSWRLPSWPGTLPLVLAALCYLVFTCVKPFSLESLLANGLVQLGRIASWLLVCFALVFPWRRGARTARRATVISLLVLFLAYSAARLDLSARWASTGSEAYLTSYLLLGRVGDGADGAAYLALAALLVSAYVRATSEAIRARLRWILAGILIALPPYFFLEQLPRIIGGTSAPAGLGAFAQLFLSFIPVFMLVALTGRRALDLRSFMARYALYAALLLAAIASFAILYLPMRDLIAREYRTSPPVAELLAAGAIVLALALARLALHALIGRQQRLGTRGFAAPMSAEPGRRNLLEMRALLAGIAMTLREPVEALTAPRSTRRDADASDAAAKISGLLRALETITGPRASIFGATSALEIIQRALERVKRRYPAAVFAVEAGRLVHIECFPEEVVQALSLVLENAVEAHQAELKPIEIRVIADQARVGIEVSDRGTGIEGRMLRKLYAPFTSAKPGHFGLGLYVAKGLVEHNQGTLDLSAGAQGGTTAMIAFRVPAEEMQ